MSVIKVIVPKQRSGLSKNKKYQKKVYLVRLIGGQYNFDEISSFGGNLEIYSAINLGWVETTPDNWA